MSSKAMSACTTETASSLGAAFARQQSAFRQDPYPTAVQRQARLNGLIQAILAHQDEIAEALDRDFGGRCLAEVRYSEIFLSLQSLRHAKRHLKKWMKSRRVPVGMTLQMAKAWVMPQPLGVVGVVVPWNYPLFLTMGPVAGALAAGNRVMLKFSEFTPSTSFVLGRLFADCFDPALVTAVEGDAETAKAFVRLPFDHLLFTGSTTIGRHVMHAAADNLTPVTLELGGKSPVVLAPDADFSAAAGSIAYGKFLNAGQTCIAPDYALVPAHRLEEFIGILRAEIDKQYPHATENRDYTSIINEKQYSRLKRYLDEARAAGTRVIPVEGEASPAERRIPPTLVIDPPDQLKLMQEEIFGPLFPIKPYHTVDEAIGYINEHPRPLALYLYTRSSAVMDQVLKRTVSGGVSINETLLHIAVEDLPFGGVGTSGLGHYHGQAGFDTLSKLKPVFQRRGLAAGALLRPPYGRLHDRVMRLLIRWSR